MPAENIVKRVEPVRMPRAPEDNAYPRSIKRPAHRQGEQTLAVPLTRQLFESPHSRQMLRETRRLKLGICPAQIILPEPRVRVNLAGEQSPAKHLVCKRGHTMLTTPCDNAFGGALKYI